MAIEQWHVDSPKTIDLELVRHLRVNMMGGSVNIMSHDLPSTRVEVSSLTGRDMKIAIDGDTLIVDHPQFGWGSLGESARTLVDPPKATVSILVPKNVSVNVKATSADVLVTGIDGEISITTIGGEHFMDSTAGKLQLTSAGGELSVRGHRGSIEARTATGDVTVTGPITTFDGNTISGSTVVDVTGEDASPTSIAHASVSGAVTVRLPGDTNASYQFATVAAKAQVGERMIEPLYGKQTRFDAPLPDSPVTEVKVNTVAGRITVLGGVPLAQDAQPKTGWTDTSGAQDATRPWDSGSGDGSGHGTSDGTARGAQEAQAAAQQAQAAQQTQGAPDAHGSQHTDQATAAGGSQATSWSVPPNPNIDLANAPRPEGNIVPPIPGAADVPSPGTPPAGTHTAAGPIQNAHLTDESDLAGGAARAADTGTESEEQR